MTPTGSCLQLDMGNSSTKWRLVEHGTVTRRGTYLPGDQQSRDTLLACSPALQQAWIASVASAETERELEKMLTARWDVQPWFARSAARCGAVQNSYSEPARMGVDRWLAMLAAWRHTGGRVCVVDAGSALTLDLLNDKGHHEGGYIIPGPGLMERALLLDTQRVRFEEAADYALSPGSSTAEAVRHGIALAQAGSLSLLMEREKIAPASVLFCGGGGQALMQLLDRGGEYMPELVFEGLEIMAAEVNP